MDFALSMQHACPSVNDGCQSLMLGSFIFVPHRKKEETNRTVTPSAQAYLNIFEVQSKMIVRIRLSCPSPHHLQ